MKRRYRVEGMVQGVGFRHFAWRAGSRLQLKGWVRNLPDGSVEAVAEGDLEHLAAFESELGRGPRLASVTRVVASEISLEADALSAFEIR